MTHGELSLTAIGEEFIFTLLLTTIGATLLRFGTRGGVYQGMNELRC